MLKSDQINVSTPSNNRKWILLCVCLFLIFILPVVCFSSDGDKNSFFTQSRLFWLHIVWCECIFLSLWYGFTGKHVSKLINQCQQTGGANVAIVYLWYRLAFWSFIFWGVSIFIPAQSAWQTVPFLLQGVTIIVYALTIFATPKTKEYQMHGMDLIPEDLPSPIQLSEHLSAKILQNYPPEMKNKIKRISEKIKYSLPQVGKISSSQNYRELVKKIEEINSSLDNETLLPCLEEITTKLNQIILECKQ